MSTTQTPTDPAAADRVESVASKIGGVAKYLNDHEPGDLLDDGRALARRHPEVVLGGLFVVGLAAARFLKASERRRDTDQSETGYSSAPRGSSAVTTGPANPRPAVNSGIVTEPSASV